MRYLLLALSLLSAAVSARPAPDFSLSSLPDAEQLSQLKGKVVYLDFWASWCKPCRKSFPFMNQLQQEYGPKGLVVLAVNLDAEPPLAAQFLSDHPAQFAVQYDPDGKIASEYELIGMPSSYLIDAAGQIRYSHQGFFADKTTRYESEIQELLSEIPSTSNLGQ